ncbi:MAG: (2Fe-2S) ferredoxin domain-containing protein, partial [Acholeplasmataceae bacterium]|nr:(2Fe-2S) ferredoxin domain-containing protein [Acholeplasmataceae bacterium]
MAYRNQIVICGGTGCMSSKSALIKEAFVRELKENNIQDEVFV